MNDNQNERVKIIKEVSNSDLNPDIKDHVLKSVIKPNPKEEEPAMLDKVFGKKNTQMYIALLMSIILLLVFVVLTCVFKDNMEFVKFLWNIAIPAITLLWGYAFGKTQS